MLFAPKDSYPLVTCSTCGTAYRDDSDWSGDAHPERDCVRAQTERETVAAIVAWLRAEANKHHGPMPGVDPVGSVRVIADAIMRGDWRER